MKIERSLGIAASVLALLGALYTAYGALTYKPVAIFRAEISACSPDPNDWLDLIRFLDANSGDVVLLYLRIYHRLGACDTDFVSWEARSNGLNQVAFYNVRSSIADRISAREARELFPIRLIGDNGVSLNFEMSSIQLNSQTRIIIADEGMYDVFSGPFQTQFGMGDAAMWFVMSPPIISDATARRIRCANMEWSYLLNVLLCPVI